MTCFFSLLVMAITSLSRCPQYYHFHKTKLRLSTKVKFCRNDRWLNILPLPSSIGRSGFKAGDA
ncbi:hypothetical protein DFP90_108139 [Aestuariispira insulae]|uniref:Uncharacterized protein n=1 Tax=Aestuariispira insulae TaxID=1461337 RepID=A0A3D9HF65_9PROT|nr:hypothetical protein DFP90_108139 [Aestuariispira insulae]